MKLGVLQRFLWNSFSGFISISFNTRFLIANIMHVKYLNTIVFFIVLLSVTTATATLFAPFMGSIFIAAIFAILFYGMYERLAVKLGNHPKLASSIMCVFVVIIIVLPLGAVGTLVVNETNDLLQKVVTGTNGMGDVADRISGAVNGVVAVVPGASLLVGTDGVMSSEAVSKATQQIGKGALVVAQKTYALIGNGIIGIFILLFTLFFFFVDGRRIMRKIMFISPLKDAHEQLLFTRFASMSRATLKGTLIIGLVQGTLAGLAFWAAGVPSVMMWAIVMTAFAIIPMIGAGFIGFPVAIYYLLTGDAVAGLILIGAFTFISLLDNYLRPVLVGHDAKMHTLLVFFATFGGIVVFGLAGFIIGPIIMVLFVTLWDIYALEFKDQLEVYNK